MIELIKESTLSLVELTQRDKNTVVISFTYNTLTEQHVEEMYTTSLEGLLGEIAGILGIMMVSGCRVVNDILMTYFVTIGN